MNVVLALQIWNQPRVGVKRSSLVTRYLTIKYWLCLEESLGNADEQEGTCQRLRIRWAWQQAANETKVSFHQTSRHLNVTQLNRACSIKFNGSSDAREQRPSRRGR